MDKSRNPPANAQHAPETILVKDCIKSIHLLIGSELEYLSYRLCVAVVVMSTGQALGCESHFGPCHQRSSSCATGPPRLPRSAGFSLVGTYLHVIQFLSWILPPGCAQTACSHLLLLSSAAQLYCQTNSRLGQQDILPGLLPRYWPN